MVVALMGGKKNQTCLPHCVELLALPAFNKVAPARLRIPVSEIANGRRGGEPHRCEGDQPKRAAGGCTGCFGSFVNISVFTKCQHR